MTKEELAKILNNCTYKKEINPKIEELAHNDALVVVFSHSLGLLQFRGAIYNSCYNEDALIIAGDLWHKDIMYSKEDRKKSKKIELIDDYFTTKDQFTFKTDIPHSKFNIMENCELVGTGIVFSLEEME